MRETVIAGSEDIRKLSTTECGQPLIEAGISEETGPTQNVLEGMQPANIFLLA